MNRLWGFGRIYSSLVTNTETDTDTETEPSTSTSTSSTEAESSSYTSSTTITTTSSSHLTTNTDDNEDEEYNESDEDEDEENDTDEYTNGTDDDSEQEEEEEDETDETSDTEYHSLSDDGETDMEDEEEEESGIRSLVSNNHNHNSQEKILMRDRINEALQRLKDRRLRCVIKLMHSPVDYTILILGFEEENNQAHHDSISGIPIPIRLASIHSHRHFQQFHPSEMNLRRNNIVYATTTIRHVLYPHQIYASLELSVQHLEKCFGMKNLTNDQVRVDVSKWMIENGMARVCDNYDSRWNQLIEAEKQVKHHKEKNLIAIVTNVPVVFILTPTQFLIHIDSESNVHPFRPGIRPGGTYRCHLSSVKESHPPLPLRKRIHNHEVVSRLLLQRRIPVIIVEHECPGIEDTMSKEVPHAAEDWHHYTVSVYLDHQEVSMANTDPRLRLVPTTQITECMGHQCPQYFEDLFKKDTNSRDANQASIFTGCLGSSLVMQILLDHINLNRCFFNLGSLLVYQSFACIVNPYTWAEPRSVDFESLLMAAEISDRYAHRTQALYRNAEQIITEDQENNASRSKIDKLVADRELNISANDTYIDGWDRYGRLLRFTLKSDNCVACDIEIYSRTGNAKGELERERRSVLLDCRRKSDVSFAEIENLISHQNDNTLFYRQMECIITSIESSSGSLSGKVMVMTPKQNTMVSIAQVLIEQGLCQHHTPSKPSSDTFPSIPDHVFTYIDTSQLPQKYRILAKNTEQVTNIQTPDVARIESEIAELSMIYFAPAPRIFHLDEDLLNIKLGELPSFSNENLDELLPQEASVLVDNLIENNLQGSRTHPYMVWSSHVMTRTIRHLLGDISDQIMTTKTKLYVSYDRDTSSFIVSRALESEAKQYFSGEGIQGEDAVGLAHQFLREQIRNKLAPNFIHCKSRNILKAGDLLIVGDPLLSDGERSFTLQNKLVTSGKGMKQFRKPYSKKSFKRSVAKEHMEDILKKSDHLTINNALSNCSGTLITYSSATEIISLQYLTQYRLLKGDHESFQGKVLTYAIVINSSVQQVLHVLSPKLKKYPQLKCVLRIAFESKETPKKWNIEARVQRPDHSDDIAETMAQEPLLEYSFMLDEQDEHLVIKRVLPFN